MSERTPESELSAAASAGDAEAVRLLLDAGADVRYVRPHNYTVLIDAMHGRSISDDEQLISLLRLLIERGADLNAISSYGESALRVASHVGRFDAVGLLLNAGADPAQLEWTPLHRAVALGSVEDVRAKIVAGADLCDINGAMRVALMGLRREEAPGCTRDEYRAAKYRMFGRSNPERMNFPFWKAMVACGWSAYHARAQFGERRHGDDGAVWCYDRFGMSLTELPDGRVVEIGGEHEDYYDPDFCIYNDVIVHHGDGTFDLYGYPEAAFPPTDFHTATLVGNAIYIIGSLGYAGSRGYGTTPVYRLDLRSLAIEFVSTAGDPPGWISKHRAKLVGGGVEVSGGKVCAHLDDEERYEDNPDTFVLDLRTMTWSRQGRS